MPVPRARLADVLDNMFRQLRADARAAARNNVLSTDEESALPAGVLKDAARAARNLENTGGRVTRRELAVKALEIDTRNIGRVNQTKGGGAAFLSVDEVRRLQGVHIDTARRAARAYEAITGRAVVLDGVLPQDPPSMLPDAARQTLVTLFAAQRFFDPAARLQVSDVAEAAGGYTMNVRSNVFSGPLFAREVDGRFMFASQPFEATTVRLVADKAKAFFDDTFADDMRGYGSSAAEVAEARAKFVPSSFYLADESDPENLVLDYPFVLRIDNHTGTDDGVFAGVNPASGDVSFYTKN